MEARPGGYSRGFGGQRAEGVSADLPTSKPPVARLKVPVYVPSGFRCAAVWSTSAWHSAAQDGIAWPQGDQISSSSVLRNAWAALVVQNAMSTVWTMLPLSAGRAAPAGCVATARACTLRCFFVTVPMQSLTAENFNQALGGSPSLPAVMWRWPVGLLTHLPVTVVKGSSDVYRCSVAPLRPLNSAFQGQGT